MRVVLVVVVVIGIHWWGRMRIVLVVVVAIGVPASVVAVNVVIIVVLDGFCSVLPSRVFSAVLIFFVWVEPVFVGIGVVVVVSVGVVVVVSVVVVVADVVVVVFVSALQWASN